MLNTGKNTGFSYHHRVLMLEGAAWRGTHLLTKHVLS